MQSMHHYLFHKFLEILEIEVVFERRHRLDKVCRVQGCPGYRDAAVVTAKPVSNADKNEWE